VHVVIGDIKTSPTYTSLNIKRGGLLTSAAGGEKLKVSFKGSFTKLTKKKKELCGEHVCMTMCM